MSSWEDAVSQYEKWRSDDLFSSEQFENIHLFFQDLMDKKGLDKTVLQAKDEERKDELILADEITNGVILMDDNHADLEAGEDVQEVEVLDISSIGITFEESPHKGQLVEFEVSFQSGNMISLIIGSKEKQYIDSLKVGLKLNNVQFYSPIAMFSGKGIITSSNKIKSGPKSGDYCLDIKIIST